MRLALEEGISTFIVMGDDTDGLRRFATEVAPAVREQVDRGRDQHGTRAVGRRRNSIALSRRRPGIDYDGLPASLADHAVEPGDAGYARYTSSYLRGGAPGLVLRPQTVGGVRDAVAVAARHRDVPLGIFSAGHGLSGRSLNNGGLVIDVGALAHASAAENPDLFWAMRGAGANFGIAVSFEFAAARVRKVAFAQLVFDASDTAGFLNRWGTAIEAADRSVSGEVILGRPQGGRQYAQALLVVDSDDPDTIVDRLQPVADIAPLLDQSVALTGYDQLMQAMLSEAPQQGQGEPHSHSGLVRHLSPDFAADAAALLETGASYFFAIRSVGGAVSDGPADATAYGWRDANFSVAAFGTRASGLDSRWEKLVPHTDGMYLSFETATGPEVLARAFPPGHLTRLRALKRRYDPTGLFRDNFYIDPEGAPRSAA